MSAFRLVIAVGLISMSTSIVCANNMIFLELHDIEGGVLIDGFQNQIAVQNFGVEVTRSVDITGGKSGTVDPDVGPLIFSDFAISTTVGKHSPKILANLFIGASGRIRSGKLSVGTLTNQIIRVFAEWEFTGIFPTRYTTNGGSGTDGISEEFAFAFQTVNYRFTEYDNNGKHRGHSGI